MRSPAARPASTGTRSPFTPGRLSAAKPPALSAFSKSRASFAAKRRFSRVPAGSGVGPGATARAAAALPPLSFGAAVMQITIADVSMSLDNVLAVAGAAKGSTEVLVIGLGALRLATLTEGACGIDTSGAIVAWDDRWWVVDYKSDVLDRDLFAREGFDPQKVTGPADLQALPFLTKSLYIQSHAAAEPPNIPYPVYGTSPGGTALLPSNMPVVPSTTGPVSSSGDRRYEGLLNVIKNADNTDNSLWHFQDR